MSARRWARARLRSNVADTALFPHQFLVASASRLRYHQTTFHRHHHMVVPPTTADHSSRSFNMSEIVYLGIDLGTSRTSITTSTGVTTTGWWYLGYPKDHIAKQEHTSELQSRGLISS